MARKVGQIIARGDRRWLIRVYLGRDQETNKRKYHNRTIHGAMREAQAYLTTRLRERDLGRDLEGAKITLNEYLDRWLETAVKPRVRDKTCQDYEGMLCRYVRSSLGERLLTALRPLDLQTIYRQMMERGLSGRTVRYTPAVLRSAMRQGLNWRLLLPTGQKREGSGAMSGTLHLAQAQSNRGPRGRKKDFPDAERLVKRLVANELSLNFVSDAEQLEKCPEARACRRTPEWRTDRVVLCADHGPSRSVSV
jgi:hypothetical protein